MKVFLLTDSPSPYQVELFNEIASQGDCQLRVGYLRSCDPLRRWTPPRLLHEAINLDSGGGMRQAREAARESDVVVFNYYFHRHATELIGERAADGGPWCFWGERPGFRQPAWAALGGRLLRRWKLARLHDSSVPIWGIGRFAIDEYRREFGPQRPYFNLPYFSDLKRFERDTRNGSNERVFLFSGSLIARKGIDLVARAFVQLACEFNDVRLRIAGDGELRQALEFVRTGVNGWLVPASDEIEILRAMREAMRLTNDQLLVLSRGARESVREHTLKHGSQRFVRFARETIGV